MKQKLNHEIKSLLVTVTLCVIGFLAGTTNSNATAPGWARQPTTVRNPYIDAAPMTIREDLQEAWGAGITTGCLQYVKADPNNPLYQYYWVAYLDAASVWGVGSRDDGLVTEWIGSTSFPARSDNFAPYAKQLYATAESKGGGQYHLDVPPLINRLNEPTAPTAAQEATNSFEGLAAIAGLIMLAGVYFIPTIVAFVRKVPQVATVAVINLLFGWTLIGWVVALCFAVWSYKKPARA